MKQVTLKQMKMNCKSCRRKKKKSLKIKMKMKTKMKTRHK